MHLSGFTYATLRISSGVLIWAVHFTAIYGFTALACALGWSSLRWLGVGVLPWTIGAATLAAVAALTAVIASALRTGTAEFIEWMMAALAGLALVAVLFEGVAVWMVPRCP